MDGSAPKSAVTSPLRIGGARGGEKAEPWELWTSAVTPGAGAKRSASVGEPVVAA